MSLSLISINQFTVCVSQTAYKGDCNCIYFESLASVLFVW